MRTDRRQFDLGVTTALFPGLGINPENFCPKIGKPHRDWIERDPSLLFQGPDVRDDFPHQPWARLSVWRQCG